MVAVFAVIGELVVSGAVVLALMWACGDLKIERIVPSNEVQA